ncbi:MAG: EF2563 family selenium-dependent molybdenum hydroxylase system protein [Armatimonadetes bacterium]|nr:EF2563 family selenium-dependent molybdenum hydroxylase system protein [Armatimonadota bacterium]
MIKFNQILVLIRGGGDLASGAAHRLFTCGFKVVILELSEPRMLRRSVSFSEAVYRKEWQVEGVKAKLLTVLPEKFNFIPILIDSQGESIDKIKPRILIDARMKKKNIDTEINQAPLVIGLGPGFKAGINAHYVIETKRGHYLGRVYKKGGTLPDTGIPGEIGGFTYERLIRAPEEGIFKTHQEIGNKIKKGEIIGEIGKIKLKSKISGIIRGLIKAGIKVKFNEKIADIDPRKEIDIYTISDKARAIGGGVLEAILSLKEII